MYRDQMSKIAQDDIKEVTDLTFTQFHLTLLSENGLQSILEAKLHQLCSVQMSRKGVN